MRLDKFLSLNGFGSRKEVKKIVKYNIVLINDELAKDSSMIIHPETDYIVVDGFVVTYKKNVVYMLNKPAGYESSNKSDLYPTVLELIGDLRTDLIIVGRLDVDTEGLLLITSDGQFSHRVSHGKKEVYKQYYIELKDEFDTRFISELETGITLDKLQIKPAKVKLLHEKAIILSIAEGKYHQVKRMMHYCNNEVAYLKRIAIGDLLLDESLEPGEYRELTAKELDLFK